MDDRKKPMVDKTDNGPGRPSGRRGFLLGAGAAGAAGAAIVATKGAAVGQPAQAEAPRKHEKGGGGYHVTDHVRQYYRTTLV